MKTYTNNNGHRFLDFKNSIETKDFLQKAIIIRWWIKTFNKTWFNFGKGYYLIEKTIGNITYCMMLDMNIEEYFKYTDILPYNNIGLHFQCYYHDGTRIKKENRDKQVFIEKYITSLDELYQLYKQGLKQWENHSKNFVIN